MILSAATEIHKPQPPIIQDIDVGAASSLVGNILILPISRPGSFAEPVKLLVRRKSPPEAADDLAANEAESLEDQLKAVFALASYEEIEDGTLSEFEITLIRLIERYGEAVLNMMADQISYNKANPELMCKALQIIGRIRHPQTHNYRFWLLQHGLQSPSIWIRDGAALGLSSLNDGRAIPFLRNAIEKEPFPELRNYMERVVTRLGGFS
ncbi:MAG: HEAT repeat domain-containing protein [Chloroflexota bacterium]